VDKVVMGGSVLAQDFAGVNQPARSAFRPAPRAFSPDLLDNALALGPGISKLVGG
jgi:hypothetical protein